MTDNVFHAGTSYFRPDIPAAGDLARFERDVAALDVSPARQVELLDVLLRDRRHSRGPGLRFLQGIGALIFAVFCAVYVPYPWTYVTSVPVCFIAMWWLAISFAHYRNTERVRAGASTAQRSLEGEDGLLWRFEPWLLSLEQRAGIRLFDTVLPTCTASRNGTLRGDLVSLRDYWYWTTMAAAIIDERELMSGGRPGV